MNTWIDIGLVVLAILASAVYAGYALGPKSLRDRYTKFATKYFGLRAARLFASDPSNTHDCHDCPASNTQTSKKHT